MKAAPGPLNMPAGARILLDVELEQLKQLLTEPVLFLVGGDGAAFHIYQGLLSRLSGPFHALVQGRTQSTNGCVDWTDVEEDVFWRFAQFVHTGSCTSFAPAEEYGLCHTDKASDAVASGVEDQAADGSNAGERLPQAHSGAHPDKASSESPGRRERSEVFRLPYSLASYESAANMWRVNLFYVPPHSTSCRDQDQPVRLPSKRKFEAISSFMGHCGGLTGPGVDDEGFNFRRTSSKRQTRPGEQSLIHAKVWFLAERYAVISLMELACSYLVEELAYWTISAWDFVPKFSALVRYVYGNRTAEECRLQRVVAQFAACVVEDVRDFEGWSGLLNEVPDFTIDLVGQVTDRLE
ncbi:hypothetical protein QBC46DRAFT_417847 [Diplogelasinospora grovesii]|uniref:BTB domain-containing protein n=1 Tax=Diplogelasinospora grovesii TaxID=303347 RepID=A0AAN6S8K5_9PEZI|nr:hypothetical protein QBC46DRAFT_417847 [Diplogelasinospora grovesii]